MNKRITIIGGAIIAAIFLTGCCLKHDWDEATCKEPKTCFNCGKTEGDKLDHDWEKATCTEPKTCSMCGKKKGEPLGHEWVAATCTEPKTCSVCGETDGEAEGHYWSYATCLEERYCYVCSESDGEKGEHYWMDASCYEPKTCYYCGETEGERLPHEWTAYANYPYCRNCYEDMPEDSFEDGEVLWNGIGLTVPDDFYLGDSAEHDNGVFEGPDLMFTVSPHWNNSYYEDDIIDYYRESMQNANYDILDEGYYFNSEGTEFYRFEIEYKSVVQGYCTLYISDEVYVYMECFAYSRSEADDLYESVINTFYVYH